MAFVVREATRADIEEMVKMQVNMALETEQLHLDEDTVRRGMTYPFEAANVATFYVVELTAERRVVAMLMTTHEWSEWRAGFILWIQSVYVLPEYRRQGLFRQMFEYLRALVQSSDRYQGLRLYVEQENKAARSTYEKLGMDVEHYRMMKWMKTDF